MHQRLATLRQAQGRPEQRRGAIGDWRLAGPANRQPLPANRQPRQPPVASSRLRKRPSSQQPTAKSRLRTPPSSQQPTANSRLRRQTAMSKYAALIPIAIVALSAIAAMLAEAFRQRDERMPIYGLGLIGLGGAAVASGVLWNSDAKSLEVIRSDNFALFINIVLC